MTPERADRLRQIWRGAASTLFPYLAKNGYAYARDYLPEDRRLWTFTEPSPEPVLDPVEKVKFVMERGYIDGRRAYRITVEGITVESDLA